MQQPEINPKYFDNDFGELVLWLSSQTVAHMLADLEMLVQHFKFTRTMASIEPWKSAIVSEVDPGPHCATDEDIKGS